MPARSAASASVSPSRSTAARAERPVRLDERLLVVPDDENDDAEEADEDEDEEKGFTLSVGS